MPENTPRLRSVVPYPMKKRMMGWGLVKSTISVVLLVVIALVVFFEGRKAYLDYQVRELCAKDGGATIFETVTLSEDKFDKFNNIKIPVRAAALANEPYFYEKNTYYYKQGNPEMWRSEVRIVRARDEKLIGIEVRYVRRGGDFPGPMHESSFGCPTLGSDLGLERKVFIKGIEK